MSITLRSGIESSLFEGEDLFFLEDLSKYIGRQIDEVKSKIFLILGKIGEYKENLEKLNLELKELEDLKKYSELFFDSFFSAYNSSLERFPSFFVENREVSNNVKSDAGDLTLFLDCGGDKNSACLDHHGISGEDDKVATTMVIDFIKENPRYASIIKRLFKLTNAPQLLGDFEEYLSSKKSGELLKFLDYLIPITEGHLDVDAILSHFSLLFPKKAVRYEKILSEAALKSDLNLEVSNKGGKLNDVITGIYEIFTRLKKQYEKYLKIKYPDEKKSFYDRKIITFDTFMANSIVFMVPKMLDFINQKDLGKYEDDKYYNFFSMAQNSYSDFVDRNTEKIGEYRENYEKFTDLSNLEGLSGEEKKEQKKKIKDLKDDGLMKISTNGKTISFIYNKNTKFNFNGIPPISYFDYIRTNNELDSSSLRYNIICQIKSLEENSSEKGKYISISIIAKNLEELKKYSLKTKLTRLNRLELLNLEKLKEKKEEDLRSLEGKNSAKIKGRIKSLNGEILSLEKKIKIGRTEGLYKYRNGLVFLSFSFSSLDDIIEILNSD